MDGARRRAMKRGLLIGVAISVVAVGVILLTQRGGSGNTAHFTTDSVGIPTQPNVAGKPVPSASFQTFDGATTSFAAFRGKPLVVNFFASWCAPCQRELPNFVAVHQKLGDKVAIVGIDEADRLDDGKAMAAHAGLTYPIGRDDDGTLLAGVGGVVMPTTIFVSADGVIVERHSGELSEAQLQAGIDKLVGP